VRLVQVANINAVLTEELFEVQLPGANNISFPISKSFPPFVLGRTAILGYEGDYGFEESSRTILPCWEEGGRGEKTAC
jgi:hypothetical protein